MLFLHIGMHKTGTTTLQNTLSAHRSLLAEHGINYLDLGANHSRPLYSMFAEHPETYHANRRAGLSDASEAAAYNANNKARVERLLTANNALVTIISGEDLSLLKKDAVPRLKAFLARYFDTLQVIGYVRPARAFINSLCVQAVKGGATLEHLVQKPPSPDYQWRFNKYRQTFGKDSVRLRLFERSQLAQNCIVADFIQMAGLPSELYASLDVQNENTSLSQAAVEFLSEANAASPVFVDGNLNPARPQGLLEKASKMAGPAFALPNAVIEQILEDKAFDISWMEKILGAQLV